MNSESLRELKELVNKVQEGDTVVFLKVDKDGIASESILGNTLKAYHLVVHAHDTIHDHLEFEDPISKESEVEVDFKDLLKMLLGGNDEHDN